MSIRKKYITESLCLSAEIGTPLYINYTSIKKKKSKRRSSGSVNAKEKSILDTGTFVQKPWDFFFFFAPFEDLNKNQGNSLVVQWLGLHNLTAKGLGLIPG